MKVREAWRLSKTPYLEVAFRSAQLNRQGNQGGFSRTTPEQRVKSIIRGTRISKITFTFFIGIGSAFPFAQYAIPSNHTSTILISAISLSLLISLGYLILYLFQILPSFTSTEPYSLLTTLPFESRDFSLVTFFSFVRTFDSQVICAIAIQVAAVAILTHSAAASLLMLVASGINVTFGIAIAIFLSRLFYLNMTRGGRSIAASVSRIIFLVTWGIAVMSFGFFFDFLPYLTSYIDHAVRSNLSSPTGAVFALVHPFSSALVITSTVYPTIYGTRANSELQILSYFILVFYLGLGIFVGRRTIGVVSSVARGQGVSIIRKTTTEFSIKPRAPLFAYILKDLRMATKSTATAFLFAFPIFEVIIVLFSFSSVSRFSAITIFSSMSIGLFFIMFMSSALLNTEASAIDLTTTLPLRPITIVNAKAVIVALMYLPVPLVMLILENHKIISSPVLVYVPFIEILAVASAGSAQIGLFIVGHRKVVTQLGNKTTIKIVAVFQPSGFSLMGGRDVVRLATSLALGVGLLAVPVGSYVISYLLTTNHIMAIVAMLVSAVVELVVVELLVQR
jgi:predicted permease